MNIDIDRNQTKGAEKGVASHRDTMKRGPLANPGARRRLAKAALSGIAADKAAGTVYDIIN